MIEAASRSAAPPAIAVVTGLSECDAALDALRAGGWTMLFKPLDAAQVSRTVAWCLAARRAQTELVPRQRDAHYRMAAAANAESDLSRVLDRVLELALGAVKADIASILLTPPPPAPRRLSVVASYGLARDAASGMAELGEGVAGWVALNQRPLRLVGPLNAYPQFKTLRSNPTLAESLIAPIHFRKESLGVLCLGAREPGRFAAEDLGLAIAAADVLATAVHRDHAERAREHQDRLAILGRLSASIAHEVRSPLAHLKATLHFVRAEAFPECGAILPQAPQEEIKAAFDEMDESVSRIVEMLEHVRISARKSTDAPQATAPRDLLNRAVALVLPQLKHQVRLEVQPGDAPEILADPNRILQILLNLIVNAAQATEGSGRERVVTARTRAEGGNVLFEVQDNGPGIPAEVAACMFQPFFTTKGEGEGTGLGLSISRQIAMDHGGELSFTSRQGEGTCFTLRLPSRPPPRSRKGALLVVDDDAALLRALCRSLSTTFEVFPAEDVEAALALLECQPVDGVLTDFHLPRRSGLDLAREVRARSLRVPVLMLTAAPEDSEVQAAFAEGTVQAVFAKPWSPTALAGQVLASLEAGVPGPSVPTSFPAPTKVP